MSDRNLLTVLSTATIQASADKIFNLIKNYEHKTRWDQNFQEGRKVMDIGEAVTLHYLRTKKIAVVSGRDQYLVTKEREIPAS